MVPEGRTAQRPMGNTAVASVLTGNTMVARMVLQVFLYEAMSVFWIIEQPRNSLMETPAITNHRSNTCCYAVQERRRKEQLFL